MPPQIPQFIFGVHDPDGANVMTSAGKPGWITVSLKVTSDGNDFSALANQGLGVIARLNNGYGSEGTIPASSQYDAFAQQCANFIAGAKGCKIWIIGNETNLAWERPGNSGGSGGEILTPQLYAQCFAKCRAAIKKIAGHADDWVIPSPPAPWNNQTAYPGNEAGDWIKYFADILNECIQLGQTPDALAIHTYTHGFKKDLVTSDEKMGAPFQNRNYHFRAYRDFLSVVPSALKNVPVLITETQAADPDWWQNQNIGWIQAAYKEINDWNANSANQTIQALCLFRWQANAGDPPGWSISNRAALMDDFRAAMQNAYKVKMPATQSPPSTPPPSQPPTAQPQTGAEANAAIAAAKKFTWMPINDKAALYLFAQKNNLGYPQTDEFEFTYSGAGYIAQVYNLGIVYVKKGDYANVK
ncbi:MAG: hypothetical protein HY070_01020, partial [Chloroflexi bacterium]|nr:hypothetical protein [Chloroflexota bacterium]